MQGADCNLEQRSLNDNPSQTPKFSHPLEAEFARILDYYGIAWQYEPTTFALEWGEDGSVTQAFAPDFYLPQENRYVELTTVRPKLVTLKNKKIRRLKDLYPDVEVTLLKRSDLRDLMIRYGMDEHAAGIMDAKAQSNHT